MTHLLIQPYRATNARWTAVNPVLAVAELGYEIDTRKYKFGDGSTPWSSLPYADAATAVAAVVAGATSSMDTLLEIDAAINNDPNYATTIATALATKALAARQVITGTGLTGGGDLTADRTLAPDFGTAAGKVTQGNDSRLSDTRTPTDGTVTTAKIVDANVTLTKLSSGVQTSLGLANTALQTASTDNGDGTATIA